MRVAVTPANIWRRGRILICGLQCRGAGCKGITLLDRAFDEFQATFMLEVTATQLPPWRATLITWTIYPPHRLLYSSDNHLNGAGTLEHGCGRHEPRPGASMVRSRAPYHGPSIFNSWAAPMVPEMVSSVCQGRSPQHQMLSFWLVSAKKKNRMLQLPIFHSQLGAALRNLPAGHRAPFRVEINHTPLASPTFCGRRQCQYPGWCWCRGCF